MSTWPFADTPNTASITPRQVLEGAPILQVTHDADDGSWQFLCGISNDPADARVVGLGRMYARDTTLGELADLPEGWGLGARAQYLIAQVAAGLVPMPTFAEAMAKA